MKDMGETSVILGVKIIKEIVYYYPMSIILRNFLEYKYYDSKTMSTPYDTNSQLRKNRGEPIAQTQYAQIIGSLLHLMNISRPDIAYAVGRLSSYTHSPNQDHWDALARLMKYLRATMDYGIE